jgi:hypothetical protein
MPNSGPIGVTVARLDGPSRRLRMPWEMDRDMGCQSKSYRHPNYWYDVILK